MKVAIATDAWAPQVNGVVRTLSETISRLIERGLEVGLIAPDKFITIPCPGYSEIRIALAPRFGTRKALHALNPDIVHIATEGPIGWAARGWCIAHKVPFTTAFHTRFPDYAAMRTGLSAETFWPLMRHFHAPSHAILTATRSLIDELAGRGMKNTRIWSRGIDHALFHHDRALHPLFANLPRPVMLSVGRVSVEKNLEAFLDSDVVGSKVIVGDGPALLELAARYPKAHFLGALKGPELASAYASADVFVFPSRTDTFGLVMIEALASGLPVAAFPVPGPLDIIGHDGKGALSELPNPVGCLDDDLNDAIKRALLVSRQHAAAYGQTFSWDRCTDQFISALSEAAEVPRIAA
ncbi:MAG: glycosyltransferase family 1 protein [Sphingorhabdus sp.]